MSTFFNGLPSSIRPRRKRLPAPPAPTGLITDQTSPEDVTPDEEVEPTVPVGEGDHEGGEQPAPTPSEDDSSDSDNEGQETDEDGTEAETPPAVDGDDSEGETDDAAPPTDGDDGDGGIGDTPFGEGSNGAPLAPEQLLLTFERVSNAAPASQSVTLHFDRVSAPANTAPQGHDQSLIFEVQAA